MAQKEPRMTNRQRVEALLKREKPDRVPVWPFAAMGFAAVYTGLSIADAYNKPEKALATQRKTAHDFDWVFQPMISYAAFGGWEFGGEIKWPSGEFSQAPTVLKAPVATPEDAMNLKMPDVKKAGIVPIMYEFSQMSRMERLDNEPFNVLSNVVGPFTFAGNICGPEKLTKWLLKKSEAAHRLLRMATDFGCQLAQYWKDSFGIEGVLVMTGEATAANQIISAKQFEQFALPYLKELHTNLLAMGYKHLYCHICGEENDNLPHWTKVPFGDPGLLSFGHEVKLETAGQFFPNHVIVGNLEPALIQAGTPDQVYEATRKNVEDGKKYCPGGYIFSPGCELPPMAKPENVMAMTRAVQDHGWYD